MAYFLLRLFLNTGKRSVKEKNITNLHGHKWASQLYATSVAVSFWTQLGNWHWNWSSIWLTSPFMTMQVGNEKIVLTSGAPYEAMVWNCTGNFCWWIPNLRMCKIVVDKCFLTLVSASGNIKYRFHCLIWNISNWVFTRPNSFSFDCFKVTCYPFGPILTRLVLCAHTRAFRVFTKMPIWSLDITLKDRGYLRHKNVSKRDVRSVSGLPFDTL